MAPPAGARPRERASSPAPRAAPARRSGAAGPAELQGQASCACAPAPDGRAALWLRRQPVPRLLAAAAALRLGLIAVAEVQDAFAEVPYTDVDYRVFLEAAESVALGQSPYSERTPLLRAEATKYRYTPLLAYVLLPSVWLHPVWGKLLFSALDLLAARLLQEWLEAYCGGDELAVRLGLCLWLFNPFCFTISTRGSGESLVVVLLYGCFVALHLRRNLPVAAGLFGLATHWRVFPIVYALPIAASLAGEDSRGVFRLVHRQSVTFGAISISVILALAGVFTAMYGLSFLQNAYLYHRHRLDPQHNFSVYFYPTALHLEVGLPNLARFALLPQAALCAWLGLAEARRGPGAAPLLQTVAFVATNKVLTAQYFVWWWAMLPLALPWLAPRRPPTRALLLWAAAEVHWLLWAYLLEFRGLPVRPAVWGASCLLLAAHLRVLAALRAAARLGGATKNQ